MAPWTPTSHRALTCPLVLTPPFRGHTALIFRALCASLPRRQRPMPRASKSQCEQPPFPTLAGFPLFHPQSVSLPAGEHRSPQGARLVSRAAPPHRSRGSAAELRRPPGRRLPPQGRPRPPASTAPLARLPSHRRRRSRKRRIRFSH
eukprot:scaffold18081_cov89-Isochrysis_galbana.AAC.1